jgi:alpha-tubulin suppressor-like RCC1 family protein
LTFASIASGGNHTCGLTTTGEAFCWGMNGFGQLGNNSTASDSVPVPVSGGLTFTELAVGQMHDCGRTAAGALFCWGDNAFGQTGTGVFGTVDSVPAPVAGGLSFGSIAMGNGHSCGLTVNRIAYCWGSNIVAELGTGSMNGAEASPVKVAGQL